MPLLEINKNPSRKELLAFVAVLPVFLALLGALLYYRHHRQAAAVLWYLVLPVALLGGGGVRWWPGAVRVVLVWWVYAVYPIGWTVSHAALAVVYYLVVTPIGLLMRLFGRDPMRRKFDRSAATYWQRHNPAGKPERYFRQF